MNRQFHESTTLWMERERLAKFTQKNGHECKSECTSIMMIQALMVATARACIQIGRKYVSTAQKSCQPV